MFKSFIIEHTLFRISEKLLMYSFPIQKFKQKCLFSITKSTTNLINYSLFSRLTLLNALEAKILNS